ncbi:DUF6151 family protein [Roseateles cellulosilyticus]|uniref:DUF6151 family protein n=1 Tax=Pelomonas cellulosilytica TaxID=2906762 RepID=A0ABS8Y1Y5_9BURK|nr:DUF6151 family protein [Pelomonas sp. P8]MCE4557688.1 DUF6151 family protein [Pelomonas sp. P8]
MSLDIQCQCGQFQARLKAFPNNTPGRLVCYCDDCQRYLHHLQRADLLDPNGGTEVIPAYPADVEITRGREHLTCTQLSPRGTFRFSTSCCNTPIVNTRPGAPWAGFMRCVYTAGGHALEVDERLGPVRSRIMGRHAQGTPPAGTPDRFNLRAMLSVMPFLLKGKLLGKASPSPFFADDGVTPIVTPHVVGEADRQARPGA